MHSYMVADVEVIRVFKGEVEVGAVLAIKRSLGAVNDIEIGDEWICFLEDYRDEQPDMPFSPLNPQQGITVVYSNGNVLLDEYFVMEFQGSKFEVDQTEFIDRIKSYIVE